MTNYVWELIQHDSSHHKWAPYAGEKWHLITSLDDHSRLLLYADFVERETGWDHIQALENVVLRYGVPYAYYTDSHSIFRFVQGRDSIWRKHYLLIDDVDPQWKQVLQECRIELRYALSPQPTRTMLANLDACETDDFILEDIPILWHPKLFDHAVGGIVLQRHNEIYVLLRPLAKKLIIHQSPAAEKRLAIG